MRPRVSTVSATAGLVALGVALRLVQYAIPRSLWFDEARNAAEILKEHWLLMLPPHSAQPTPFGFLYVERAFVALLGESELALRLFPLIAGIAALAVAAKLAHRSLDGWAAPFAVALVALSGPAIYFSTEVKQYSSDLLAGLLIASWFAWLSRSDSTAGLTPNAANERRISATSVALFALFGAMVLWISYTSLFFLAVAGALLIAQPIRARDRRGSLLYAAMGSAWLASFALHYQIAIQHWSATRWLTGFWSAGFPREGSGLVAGLDWSISSFIAAFENPLGITLGGGAAACVAGVLFALGAWICVTRSMGVPTEPKETDAGGERLLVLFTGVFALAFGCALFRVYPFKGRLLLFLVPAMAFLVARGGAWLADVGRAFSPGVKFPLVPAAAIALTAVLLAGDAWSAWRLAALEPLHRHGTVNLTRIDGVEKGFEGASEVVRHVSRNHQPGDIIYLYYSAAPDYAYYSRRLDFHAPTVTGVRSQGDYERYAADLEALRGHSRVWVVFSNTVTAEKNFIVQHLERMGTRIGYYRRPRADAFLFDLRLPGDRSRRGKTPGSGHEEPAP